MYYIALETKFDELKGPCVYEKQKNCVCFLVISLFTFFNVEKQVIRSALIALLRALWRRLQKSDQTQFIILYARIVLI